jgi:hypothetical protein
MPNPMMISASQNPTISSFCRKLIANATGDNSSSGSDCVEEFHLIHVGCEALAP